ncbi:MAG: CDP-alcohol phosphatidyltransferase family protein [Candidatus Acidiferrales bacterium]
MRIEVLARPFRWVLDRSVDGLARARVPASCLTLISFAVCILAGVLFGTGRFFSAGLVMIPAAACDLLARPLARRQPRVDFFGAFLKSVLHRYADLAIFMGLLVYYSTVNRFLYALLTGFVMAGAVMVSYSQARAESLIERCRVGFWERPERLGLMILGAVLNRLPIALMILAIGTNFTVIHRIYHTWKETEGNRRAAEQAVVAGPPFGETQSPVAARSEFRGEPLSDQTPDSPVRDLLARAAKRGA